MLLVIAGIVASSPSSSQYIGGRKDGLNLDTNIDMDTVERVATFEDVRHTFTSDFKLDPSCPTKIQFMSEPVVDRNIGKMPIRDIKEDGKRCKGEYDISSFKLVSEATVKSGTLLKTLGYGRAYDAIRKNSAALAIVQNNKPDSSLLVGFDEGTRTCGKSKYGEETFWFFIREPNTFRIIIRVGDNARLTNITVPKDKRALFVTDGKKKLCLLSDKSTAKGKKVLIQKENGKPTPSPPSKSKKSPPSAQVTPSTSADDGSNMRTWSSRMDLPSRFPTSVSATVFVPARIPFPTCLCSRIETWTCVRSLSVSLLSLESTSFSPLLTFSRGRHLLPGGIRGESGSKGALQSAHARRQHCRRRCYHIHIYDIGSSDSRTRWTAFPASLDVRFRCNSQLSFQ